MSLVKFTIFFFTMIETERVQIHVFVRKKSWIATERVQIHLFESETVVDCDRVSGQTIVLSQKQGEIATERTVNLLYVSERNSKGENHQ